MAETLSLDFVEISNFNIIQKNATYEVLNSDLIQKNAGYTVIKTDTIQKNSGYVISSTLPVLSIDLIHITVFSVIIKNAGYAVEAFNVIQKSGGYSVIISDLVQKACGYSIGAIGESIQKSAKYSVITSSVIQKDLGYFIVTTDVVQKNAGYAVESLTQTLSLDLVEISSFSAFQKNSGYEVISYNTIQKSGGYEVFDVFSVIQKTARYEVVSSSAIQKSAGYSVLTEMFEPVEMFLDQINMVSQTGLDFQVNKPVKNVLNPIITPVPGVLTWDHEKDRFTILTSPDWPSESRYRGWYMARTSDYSQTRMCYMYSATGEPGSWILPNLGLVSYGGNTNNNIWQENLVVNQVIYDSEAISSEKYIFVVGGDASQPEGQRGCFRIYKSSSPTSIGTLVKTIFDNDPADIGTHIVQRDDGKWIGYFQDYAETDREIGYYISDTNDNEGSWTLGGVTVSSSSTENQKYYMSVLKISENPDIFLGFIPRFNKTTELLPFIELSVSRNATDWTDLDTEWIGLGNSPAWDDSIVQDTATLFRRGNTWTHPFTGGTEDHATSAREFSLGYADIGYGRIGSITPISTNGYYKWKKILPNADQSLKINGDFSGEGQKLEVELLDLSGNPITGYTREDCDDITIDTYNRTVTWGANNTLPEQHIDMVFYLNGGKLHSFGGFEYTDSEITTKNAGYCVLSTGTIQKTGGYEITDLSVLQKSAGYRVILDSTQSIDAGYLIQTTFTIQKTTAYAIFQLETYEINAGYEVTPDDVIQKSAGYVINTFTQLLVEAEFEVANVESNFEYLNIDVIF